MPEAVTFRLRITGRVQGVGYRISMVVQATELGVAGWVRNRMDGSVEAMVQGEAAVVERLLAWARQGPRHAQVQDVEVTPDSGEFAQFGAWPDA